MFVYWAMFCILAIGALLSQPRGPGLRLAFILLVSIPTALMIGLRWQIGPDWNAYLEIFNYTKPYTFERSATHADPGFFSLLWALHQFDAPFWVENAICGTVFVAGLTTFCQRHPNPWLAYILAFPYLVIVIAMSGNRQSLALGFLFMALSAFEQRKTVQFTLLTMIAALFHASAILMLPIGLLSLTSNKFVRAALLVACVLIANYVLRSAFDLYVRRYSGDRIQSAGVWYRLAINAVPSIIFLRFQKMFSLEEHERIFWRNVSILNLIAIPAAFVVPSSTALDRVILYFFPLQFVVLSRWPFLFQNDRQAGGARTMMVIAYAALIQLVFLNLGTYASYYIPYKSIFEQSGDRINGGRT